ncbi:cytochrome b (mitochondrion) [Saccharomyces cerevisiae S288C]|uniref:Cytochrome b n=2 Tax=Saccharomyces cerevisiae TaxID=4932 RepID=CYB_YEAST|nr:cytochrome b [Saccharomyces cerevisiae S288C]P00163.3 RecName: Full=Cytochrome b; AltName: Full=Complex III subunit 3; AltName: Full=Complex III subunit CYTB; AltName: Full=Complex III subunit III; AltName: Full=Cytochrome b-c1 complex subunit 3; AltName: Full=Cytochrome b-c1 complex subunit CYTB; AltName: Full=Ubiquinol-cytochrome c oxidoreductase complex cytochrome b subunit [Saccharomyces cerevisiae S288C]3CX5_C Chain C, CYTOCHROME B [unidentified]3CX5_N Chain N, CYTOCHROME B [unidentified|eukprot:NP_009315.1 cytochrome b (mitochondrion) [Saccharomyces cerevisiae S288C]
MAFRKSNVYLSLVNSYIIDSPQPSSINYWWNMGSLLGLCLVIQIVTGIFMAMHYSSNIELAFSSVEHIMRDVHNGYILRYLHANGASFFFMVMFMHMAKGLYYGSYRSPRVTLWNVGVIIFILTIATAFLGYCCVYGQMSHWGATVITNLFSAIPFVGNDIVSWLWGGFSVSNPTIQRFFALHYLVPFIIAAMVIMHLMALHIHGSSNPLGITGNLDRIPMHSYFIFKDLVTVFLFMLILALFVFYSPNTLGHPDNYIPGNPLVTPASIVPEWYLLPFYAILRSIPDKLLGVITMFAAILVLLVLPFTDRSVVRGNTFKVLSKFFFFIFVFNFVLLGQIGACHVEVPYVLMGQIATFIYFAYFLIIVPVISTIENVLFYIGRVNK